MRVVVHDYGNYPFSGQLASELARRGHKVLHVSSGSYSSPNIGHANPGAGDHFETAHILLESKIEKSSLARRWRQEREYGRRLTARASAFRPDVVVSANAPLEAQAPLLRSCRKAGIRFVNWIQDAYGTAADRILRKRLGPLGAVVGTHYLRMEAAQLRESDFVIVISDDFLRITDSAGVPRNRVRVIPNWAPLDEIVVEDKDNTLSRELGLADSFNFVYTGTLGMKHNPELLLALATSFDHSSDVRVVVVSEGPSAGWLEESARRRGISNLIVVPFLPRGQLSSLLASSDVLVGILESGAGEFSVPSKVLTYLCAGRPILLAVPPENLAARTVDDADAGLIASPDDPTAFIAAATKMHGDDALRKRMSSSGRRYAESAFQIERIATEFEEAMQGLS